MTSMTVESADRTEVRDSISDLRAEAPADGSLELERPVEAPTSVQSACRVNSRSSWQVLGQRDFRLYFFGSLISNLGTWLQNTAQILIAYRVTHSVFMVGLIASAQFAGMVISPWAPILADRLSPRAVLVGTQGFSALIAGLMAWRYHDGLLGVHTLLVGALGLGFAFALALPVQTALVPALVDEDDAADAVKMNSVSYNAGRALAPALCVPVIIFVGPDLIFALNALSFAIFTIILRRLPRIANDTSLRRTFRYMLSRLLYATASLPLIVVRRASPKDTASPTSETSVEHPRARVTDGLITALRRRRLLLLLAIVAAVTLADDPILVLSPAVAARLHMPGASAGYFIAALGWGSVLGSLPPISVRGNSAQHASRHAAFSLLILGASIVVFATGLWAPASLIAASVAGAAALYAGTAAQTALLRHHQKNGPDVAAVASVAAMWAIAWAGTKPFASLVDGWLASRHGIVFTSIMLTAPAIIIALCELLLPHEAKRRINNRGERIVSGIAHRSIRPLTTACPQLPSENAGSIACLANPNPTTKIFPKSSLKVVSDDLSGHVILLRGTARNAVTKLIYELPNLPVNQVTAREVETGKRLLVDREKFLPKWPDGAKTVLNEDIGLLMGAPDPLNSSCVLILRNDAHSRGARRAVRNLIGVRVRNSNEQYIARNFASSGPSASLRDVSEFCLIYYDVDDERKSHPITLARRAKQQGWWYKYDAPSIAPLVSLEIEAECISSHESAFSPWAFQTEQHARPTVKYLFPRVDDSILDEHVSLGLRRQELPVSSKPLYFQSLADEPALCRPLVCDATRERHPIILGVGTPNTTTQIVPLKAGAYLGLHNASAFLESNSFVQSPLAFVEHASGAYCLRT